MNKYEAQNWLSSLLSKMGKSEHRELWIYAQPIEIIMEMLEDLPEEANYS